MIKRFTNKAILLSAMLASTAAVSAAALAQTQNASSVTLELFSEKPTESSEALATLEVGQDTGSLESIEVPDTASKARYMRANVTADTGQQSYLFRVIAAPSNGRIFILTPERKAIALNKFLAASGMEVTADKGVKLGTQIDFVAQNAAVSESTDAAGTPNATEAAPTSTTTATAPTETVTATTGTATTGTATTGTATDSSTTPAAPADTATPAATTPAATTPATDANAATPAATPADASATPAATPADASAAPTTPATTAAPADASATTAATTTATTTATPASSSGSDAKALNEPVKTTLGKVELTVIPTGATAPASSASNFILTPIAGATEAKSSLTGNVVTLSYGSSSGIADVAKFYDDQFKAQGFTLDEANAANASGADQVVRVYKRGTASVTMTVRADGGAYTVTVDLGSLASGS